MADNMAMAIIAAILNLLIPGVGYFVIGQNKKGLWGLIYFVILLVVCWIVGILLSIILIGFFFFFVPWIWGIILAIDAFMVSQQGKPGETDCALMFLTKLPGFH